MTTLEILGIVLLYLGIFIGVWRWSFLFIKCTWDPSESWIAGLFIGLLWPVSGIAYITRRILNRLIKKF